MEFLQSLDHALELRPLLTERLGTLGVTPNIGLLQLALDLDQTLVLGIEVKDTSSRTRSAPEDRGFG